MHELCYEMLANWGANTGREWAVNVGAGLEAVAAAGEALMGGGCGEYACGMGLPVGGAANLPKPSLGSVKSALAEVHSKVGKLAKGRPGKFGSPQRGDQVKGYRLDPAHPKAKPGTPEEGWHINWWDWTAGKRGAGGRSGAVPIKEP